MDFPSFQFNSGHSLNESDSGESIGFGSFVWDLYNNLISSEKLDTALELFKVVNPAAAVLAEKALSILRSVTSLSEGDGKQKINKIKTLVVESYDTADKILQEAGIGFKLSDIIEDWKTQSRGCWQTLEDWAQRDPKLKSLIPVLLVLYYSQEGINTDLSISNSDEPAWKQLLTSTM